MPSVTGKAKGTASSRARNRNSRALKDAAAQAIARAWITKVGEFDGAGLRVSERTLSRDSRSGKRGRVEAINNQRKAIRNSRRNKPSAATFDIVRIFQSAWKSKYKEIQEASAKGPPRGPSKNADPNVWKEAKRKLRDRGTPARHDRKGRKIKYVSSGLATDAFRSTVLKAFGGGYRTIIEYGDLSAVGGFSVELEGLFREIGNGREDRDSLHGYFAFFDRIISNGLGAEYGLGRETSAGRRELLIFDFSPDVWDKVSGVMAKVIEAGFLPEVQAMLDKIEMEG